MRWLTSVSLSSTLLVGSFLIAGIIFLRYVLPGISTPPVGDNVHIHIASAKSILNGTFLHPKITPDTTLYPASNEAILALFILLQLPVNTFNILGIILLFIVSIYLGRVFDFRLKYALFFALAICSIFDILRWSLSQSIDIWLLVWFLLTLALLYKPKPNAFYYLVLGFSSGMLLGSRFTAPATLFVLFVFYFQNFLRYITIRRLLLFLAMISIFGLFWYGRNFFATGDPFFPQSFFMFKGACKGVCSFLSSNVLKTVLIAPSFIVNAFISEYMIWSLTLISLPIFFISSYVLKQEKKFSLVNKLTLLAMCNLIIYLFFPSGIVYDGVVGGIRYSLPTFGVCMLALFLLVKQFHFEDVLEIVTFANMSFLVVSFSYHPKLLYLYVPLVTFILFALHWWYKNIAKKYEVTGKNLQTKKKRRQIVQGNPT